MEYNSKGIKGIKVMYICLECGRSFQKEESMQKHFLACWRERHPGHHAKDAPRSADIIARNMNNEVLDFFNSFQKE